MPVGGANIKKKQWEGAQKGRGNPTGQAQRPSSHTTEGESSDGFPLTLLRHGPCPGSATLHL